MKLTKNTAAFRWTVGSAVALCVVLTMGCSNLNPFSSKFAPAPKTSTVAEDWTYHIGPGDSLQIFVWRHEDLSSGVTVRPDGRISTALIKEHIATGKTPPELALEIEGILSEYVRDPLVTVFVGGFVGEYVEQIRVVGEATSPMAIPYKRGMTALDMLIHVGGITEFAAGNKTVLVRYTEGVEQEFNIRLDDLVRDGDISANIAMQPGDILIIPEAWF